VTRVLCVRLSAMGDVVQSLGAVQALHALRPDLELAFATQREHAPLLRGIPGIAHVVEHDRRAGLAGLFATRRLLKALGCAIALDLQGNGKGALCAWLSGARERIGAAAAWRQEPWSRVLLTALVDVPGPRHPALVATAVVRALAPGAPAWAPRLRATGDELAAAAAAVRAAGVDPERPFAAVVVGRSGDPRSLRPEALQAELAGGGPLLLVAGPGERDEPLPERVPAWRQQPGELRLLIALGALLAQNGGEAVGGDHGPMHVLAAAGARTTVWFGPQDPDCTAPPTARVLRHAAPPPCLPCRARVCRHPQGPVCMAFPRALGREHAAPSWLQGTAP
jgi:ADP-heptose:LPS heptosyltransferase